MNNDMIVNEIIGCGITSEDSILHFGAGYKGGLLPHTLCKYWGVDANDFTGYTGVDVNGGAINSLNPTYPSCQFDVSSMQKYIDSHVEANYDWLVLTGVFNNFDYGDRQYEYIFETVSRCMAISNTGVIFTINQNVTESFSYSPVFIFTRLISTYPVVFTKKFADDTYIFSIIK